MLGSVAAADATMPANSHSLRCLVPADLRHWSHASRTISHAWLTNPCKLFLNTCLNSEKFKKNPRRQWMMTLCSNAIKACKNFSSVHKSSEKHRKALEVAGTFWEILDMTRRGSHAFDSIGRYTCIMPVDWMTWLVVWCVTC